MAAWIGVILGSSSDIDLARKVGGVLDILGVTYEVTIASAHRTPNDVVDYVVKAEGRGIRVLIAIAGLSAALPGVVSSHTCLPVIGVPVASGALDGLDALLSVAQMPPGVPVATMGIDGAKNAALFAVRILALCDEAIRKKLDCYVHEAEIQVRESRSLLGDLPVPPPEAY